MNGTWETYEYIINEISKEFTEIGKAKTKDFYTIKTYNKCFIGSYRRKVKHIVDKMDDIEIYINKNIDGYKVWINGKEGNFF